MLTLWTYIIYAVDLRPLWSFLNEATAAYCYLEEISAGGKLLVSNLASSKKSLLILWLLHADSPQKTSDVVVFYLCCLGPLWQTAESSLLPHPSVDTNQDQDGQFLHEALFFSRNQSMVGYFAYKNNLNDYQMKIIIRNKSISKEYDSFSVDQLIDWLIIADPVTCH